MTFLKFSSPTTIGVYGSQQSGKTYFIKRLLENHELFSEIPNKILYCYNVNQPLFEEMEETIPNFHLKKGLPSDQDIDELTDSRKHSVLVLDDLMSQVSDNSNAEDLFTMHSHHKNMTVI